VLLVALWSASGAVAASLPDLTVSKITATGSLTPGSTVTATVTTSNVGTARAAASTTKLFASKDQFRGSDDILLGQASVPALAPGTSVTTIITAKVPAKSSNGELLGCADAGKVVVESSESNNCRAALDSDLDGWANFTDCAPSNALINPGAVDKPDVPAFTDTNCDGIDGNARQAIFVAPNGLDTNPGTRAQPMKTLAAAVPLAASKGKDVYAKIGVYPETLIMANGVGVYGGYGAKWQRTLATPTAIIGQSPVFGDTVGAIANTINVSTALQLVTLAPQAPTISGSSSYGLRGAGSPGLRLDHVTVSVGPGVAGFDGSSGVAGQAGGDGASPVDINHTGAAGSSPVGHTGGNGGPGGNFELYPDPNGGDGAPGQLTTPDAWGLMGGPGGPGGAADIAGGRGYDGDSGRFLGDGSGGVGYNTSPGSGYWSTGDGGNGLTGTDGHGGGGGGGGGGQDSCICVFPDQGGSGGGGGGGGQGGGGGGRGQGGGGSFGIYLDNSTGATVRASTVTVADGGAGGLGAGGAFGGSGGGGALGGASSGSNAADGAQGGNGGIGGRGGDGGGGAGGPSIAIYGLTSTATPGTTLHLGTGGLGGSGGSGSGNGGGSGANGVSADYY
jgi:CARDB